MGDCISRKAAIEKIRVAGCQGCGGSSDTICGFCDYENAVRLIKNLPAADVEPVRRWISTDERQPEKRGRYLVVEQNWLNKLNVQEAKWNGEDWLTVEKKREITPRVIYWMPLPEPPEMDGGVENE